MESTGFEPSADGRVGNGLFAATRAEPKKSLKTSVKICMAYHTLHGCGAINPRSAAETPYPVVRYVVTSVNQRGDGLRRSTIYSSCQVSAPICNVGAMPFTTRNGEGTIHVIDVLLGTMTPTAAVTVTRVAESTLKITRLMSPPI